MSDVRDRLSVAARNLLTLEVSTILTPHIVAKQALRPEEVVEELASLYDARLTMLQTSSAPAATGAPAPADAARFEALSERARDEIRQLESAETLSPEDESRLRLFHRIRNHCDQVARLLQGVKARRSDREAGAGLHSEDNLSLGLHESILLRRLWELGLEEIAIQTVVQLDGRVLTRIHPRYAADGAKTLHEVHQRAVSTSIQFWKSLAETLSTFMEGVARWVLRH